MITAGVRFAVVIVTVLMAFIAANTQRVQAAESDNLVVGTVDNFLPCSDKTGSGVYQGMSLDAWRRVAESTKIEYNIVSIPTFSRAIQMAADGKIDVLASCPKITASRLEVVRMSVPYVGTSIGFLSLKEEASPTLEFFFKIITNKILMRSLCILIIASLIATICVGRLENGFTHISGFTKEKKVGFLEAWLLILLGSGFDKTSHRTKRSHFIVLFAGLFRILFISLSIGTIAAIVREERIPLSVDTLSKQKLRLMLQGGIAVSAETAIEKWLMTQMDLNSLTPSKSSIYRMFGEKDPINALLSGRSKHIVSDIGVLNDIHSQLPSPDRYHISHRMGYTIPVGFAYGSNLDRITIQKIDAAIATMNFNGSMHDLVSYWKTRQGKT